MRALRLLFLSSEQPHAMGTGGVGSYVRAATAALASAGHEVHVLSCLRNVPSEDRVVAGVHLHTRPLLRMGARFFSRSPETAYRLTLGWSAYFHARALGRFDAIEAPDWRAESLLLTYLSRTPVVVHLHTPLSLLRAHSGESMSRDARWADRLEALAANRAAAVTCPAKRLVRDLQRQGWLKRDDVDIIRYPVEITEWPVQPPPMDRQALRVLVVGRVEARKGPDRLVRIVARAAREHGLRIEVVFAGRSSGAENGVPYEGHIRELARQHGVTCHFLGEVARPELPGIYRDADVVCVPSRYESFSMVAIEAMSSGRPVVLSHDVGAAEILADDPRGQVVPKNTENQLLEALTEICGSAERRAELARHNRAVVERSCAPDVVASLRTDVYLRVGSAGPAGGRGTPMMSRRHIADAVSATATLLQLKRAEHRGRRRVTVIGVYRRKNASLIASLLAPAVRQGWGVSLWALDEVSPSLQHMTVGAGSGGKFDLLNAILQRRPVPPAHDLLIVDDDVSIVRGSLAACVGLVRAAQMDLAQPAHAPDSLRSHEFTIAQSRNLVRLTTFVEIGPIVVVRPSARRLLTPFPASLGMGWGLEAEWSKIRDDGRRLGIVDAVTLHHTSPAGSGYDAVEATTAMRRRLRESGVEAMDDLMQALGAWRPWQRRAPWLKQSRLTSPSESAR